MKKKDGFLILSLVSLFLIQMYSCKKDSEASLAVLSTTIIKITQSTAICDGNLSSNGGATIIERGFCWSANQNPTISDNKACYPLDHVIVMLDENGFYTTAYKTLTSPFYLAF